MSDLLVIAFNDETSAFDLRTELMKMQGEYLIKLEDAVVVTRPEADDIQLHQAMNLTAAGALGGTFWGTFVGLLFMNPLVGAAVGAGSGALAGYLTDYGINDDFMREIGQKVVPGGSALFLLVHEMTRDKVLDRIADSHKNGRVIQSSLSKADEERLREALSNGVPSRPEP
ncbi:MAG: DUF1269 domain-containing protein [Paracoccus sp. (in: a-proteobacteria)]